MPSANDSDHSFMITADLSTRQLELRHPQRKPKRFPVTASNPDMVSVFPRVPLGTPVFIHA